MVCPWDRTRLHLVLLYLLINTLLIDSSFESPSPAGRRPLWRRAHTLSLAALLAWLLQIATSAVAPLQAWAAASCGWCVSHLP